MLTSRRGSRPVLPDTKADPGSAFKVRPTGRVVFGTLIAASISLSAAQAATFGHSRIVSALGQPLHLEIPVTQLTQQEIETLRAVPAPAAAWREAGMTPPVALDSMRLVLLDGYRPDVKVIQLRSEQAFDRPIVDVLLDVRSASGQQRYQVSLLAHADRHAVARAGEEARHPRVIDGRGAPAQQGEHPAAGRQIQVRAGDNMFAIARRNAVQGVTVYQMMIALQRANQQAFIQDNVNLVKAGATLTMPGMDALTALSDREARRVFQQHAQAFARYGRRGNAADVAAVSTSGAAAQGDVSPQAAADADPDTAAASPASGDRLRLSGAPGDASALGVSPAAGAAGNPATVSLLASSGAIASDAVTDHAPVAVAGDTAGGGSAVFGSDAGTGGTLVKAGNGPADPDDQAAAQKNVNETQTRVLELEDNVRHLNEALQKQGHVAAEAALEGARSVSEAIKEVIGLVESEGAAGKAPVDGTAADADAGTGDATEGATGTAAPAGGAAPDSAAQNGAPGGAADGGAAPASNSQSPAAGADGSGSTGPSGTATPGAQVSGATPGVGQGQGGASAPAGQGAPGRAAGVGSAALPGQPPAADSSISSPVRTEKEVSWLQENMLAVIGGGLALIVLLVVWLLRRASAAKRDIFESDSPISDSMVRERLSEIDLDLDSPSSGGTGPRT